MNGRVPNPELHFSTDFASRVLNEADAIARRRRRWRMSALSVGAAGVALTLLWGLPQFHTSTPVRVASASQIAASGALTWPDETGSADPMQWMFPDAQPVAQFADGYSNSMIGNASQRQRILFADDADQEDSL